MKTLLLLRHAKSNWEDDNLDDHDRSLSKRGMKDAPRIGIMLRAQGLLPDLILCSSAQRARSTAELAAETSGYGGEIRLSRELYAAPPTAYLEALRELPDSYQQVMVVGHNPGLEILLEILTGETEALSTASLAYITLPVEQWAELSSDTRGELVNIWRPKELK